ncbi:MAG: GAF domain-containing protein [Candidatus Rokubacteria bacterium]|nr:GAF domain-containing protein [Candidatus Rokubacteria bacterium]
MTVEAETHSRKAAAPSRTIRLREAASTIFALVTLVPFLVLLLLLHRYDALAHTEAQIGLLLALTLAILGFVVLQRLFAQFARLADAMLTPEAAAGAVTTEPQFGTVNGVGQVAEIGQIGSAFARMLEDLKGSTVRLEDLVFKLGALNEVVELAARLSNIDDLLSLVLERCIRTVRATAGAILLIDDERRQLSVAAVRGLPDAALPGGDIALGDGVAGATAQRGEPVVVDDLSADPRFAGAGAGAYVCVPLGVEGRIIGVVILVRRSGGALAPAFTPTDLQFLTTLMAHVGYSLEHARLLAETRETAARLGSAVRDLQAAQQRLVEGETLRAMGQMASGMAHHLNNLLAVSSGRIQLLLLRASDAELRRQLGIAHHAMEDAADVVRRVLEFSVTQPQTGDAIFDLNEVVAEVVELARPRWHDEAQLRGTHIDIRQQLGTVSRVAGEASSLREVVMNLVLNAIDALSRGGTITIRTWETDGEVYCSIADTGDGMSDEVRRRAVEPFFTTKGPQGVGLGLSVSHTIVQRHRGDLTIESAPGRGTDVTFHIPHAPAGVPAAVVESDGDASGRRILLIDDQPEIREMLTEALAAHGHVVAQVGTGGQALDRLARGEAVDLVLTDLGMPDMTGWEIAESIRRRWPDLPVGLITGWGARSEGTLEQRQSVAFIVAKPFTIETLLTLIARVPRRARG